MGVGAIGTRTDESLGQAKANSRPIEDRTRQIDAGEYGRLVDAVIELQEAVGKTSGPGASSLEARMRCYTPAALAALAGPYDAAHAITECHTVRGDGGGGKWFWHVGSTPAHNGGTVLRSSNLGCWRRNFDNRYIHAAWFGATGNPVVDATVAWLAALAEADGLGMPVKGGPGTHTITGALRHIPATYLGVYGRGPRIHGCGIHATIFDNLIEDDDDYCLLDLDSQDGAHASFKATLGVELRGFTIKRSASTKAATGIRMRSAYMVDIRQVVIDGMSQDGIEIQCLLGDTDGSNMIELNKVQIRNCARWGIKADAASGHNETSFLHLNHTFIESGGTYDALEPQTPTSGGMIWKGQKLTFSNGGFVTCNNVCLYVKGDNGLGLDVLLDNVTLENLKGRAYLYCSGVNGLRARTARINGTNSLFKAQYGFEFNGASYIVRNVAIEAPVIKAGSHQDNFTAFAVSGANAELESMRVRGPAWESFNYAGQTRFSGWRFDPVEQQCKLEIINSTIIRFHPVAPSRGYYSPFRYASNNQGGTVPSTSGEWGPKACPTAWKSLAPTTGSGPEVPATDLEGNALAASTRYYIYLWDDANVHKLSFSTTAPVIDPATGYPVRATSGAGSTQLYVGSVMTDASVSPNIRIATTGIGWLNPTIVSGGVQWLDSSSKLRVKTTAPTSDTDGTIAGTQS